VHLQAHAIEEMQFNQKMSTIVIQSNCHNQEEEDQASVNEDIVVEDSIEE
jgi:hypothetical protein